MAHGRTFSENQALIRKARAAMKRATQPSVKRELQKRIDRLEGGGTKSGQGAFDEAMILMRKRRKMQQNRGPK